MIVYITSVQIGCPFVGNLLFDHAVETFKALLKIKKEFFYEKFCFIFGHCCKISQEMEGVGTGQGLK